MAENTKTETAVTETVELDLIECTLIECAIQFTLESKGLTAGSISTRVLAKLAELHK